MTALNFAIKTKLNHLKREIIIKIDKLLMEGGETRGVMLNINKRVNDSNKRKLTAYFKHTID